MRYMTKILKSPGKENASILPMFYTVYKWCIDWKWTVINMHIIWWIHVDIWQNQYNIVKLKNKKKVITTKQRKEIRWSYKKKTFTHSKDSSKRGKKEQRTHETRAGQISTNHIHLYIRCKWCEPKFSKPFLTGPDDE